MAKIIDTFRDLPHKLHLGGGVKAKANDKQLKQFKEFFDIKPACKFGFPECATAVAHDESLDLLAVGSKAGEIFVFGAPGVEFFASHHEVIEVKRLTFLPNEGRLLSLTSDNRLHKWELNAPSAEQQQWQLDHVASLEVGPADSAEGQRVTSVAVATSDSVWLGYENGKIRTVDVKSWKFGQLETSSEIISEWLSDEAKTTAASAWGSVVAMAIAPQTKKQPVETEEAQDASQEQQQPQEQPLLIAVGFRGGQVALLGASDAAPKCLTPASTAELDSIAWRRSADDSKPTLLTGYADGAYAEWQLPELPDAAATADVNNEEAATEESAKGDEKVEGEAKPAEKVPPAMAVQLGDRTTVYGPFPCQPVTLLAGSTGVTSFAGGLAKNTHADVHSVTLMVGTRQACYQLPAAPVGLILPQPDCLLAVCQTRLLAIDIEDKDWRPIRPPYLRSLPAADAPATVARVFGPLSGLPESTRLALEAAATAASASAADGFSQRDWPVKGGRLFGETSSAEEPAAAAAATDVEDGRHLLVTGHADGGVAFWMLDAGKGLGVPFGRLDTGRLFVVDAAAGNGTDASAEHGGGGGDAFPKLLRNVGVDFPPPPPVDSRLAVVDVQLVGEGLLVTGAGGQAIVWSPTAELDAAEVRLDLRTVRADFLAEGSAAGGAYEWTGPEALQIRPPEAAAKFAAPFRPSCLALLSPPGPVTSAAYSQRWGLLAIGSPHGVAIFDTRSVRQVAVHPTLPVAHPAGSDAESGAAANGAEGGGLGNSLRQSFRMLKKFRPGRKQEYTVNEKKAEPGKKAAAAAAAAPVAEEKKPEEAEACGKVEEKKEEAVKQDEEKQEETAKKEDEPAAEGAAAEPAEADAEAAQPQQPPPPPEKQKLGPLDARPRGQVGALLIAETHLTSAAASVVSLLAGDAAGRVLAFQLTRPPVPPPQPAKDEAAAATAGDEATEKVEKSDEKAEQPSEGDWQAQLAKELHLKHGAPVAGLYALSARNHSIVDAETAVDGPHELLVASEEQVKLFSLPGLKPRVKSRLPGRLVASGHAVFPSSTRPDVREFGLVSCLDNGTLLVLGFPGLRVHAWRENLLRKSAGVAVCCTGGAPVAVILEAGGRLVTVHRLAAGSLGAAFQRSAGLDLPEGARKKPEEPPQAQPSAAAAAPAAAAEAAAEVAPATNGTGEDKEEEAKPSAKEEEKEGEEGPKPVAADITMDDIKEYATGTGPTAVTAEPIPEVAGEDKRESTVSGGENADKEAPAQVTPAAEIKCGGGAAAEAHAEPAAENCKSAE